MAISKQEISWNAPSKLPVSPPRQLRRPFKTGSYFDHHVSWSLALIAAPAVFHFLVQFAIHQGMRRSAENRLVRLAGLICTFAVAFGAGLTEVTVADILFLGCFP